MHLKSWRKVRRILYSLNSSWLYWTCNITKGDKKNKSISLQFSVWKAVEMFFGSHEMNNENEKMDSIVWIWCSPGSLKKTVISEDAVVYSTVRGHGCISLIYEEINNQWRLKFPFSQMYFDLDLLKTEGFSWTRVLYWLHL